MPHAGASSARRKKHGQKFAEPCCQQARFCTEGNRVVRAVAKANPPGRSFHAVMIDNAQRVPSFRPKAASDSSRRLGPRSHDGTYWASSGI